MLTDFMSEGKFEYLEFFLKLGLDPNLVDNAGTKESLLHIAAKNKSEEGVRLLIKFSANPNVMNYYEETPLHACIGRNFDNLKFLIKWGADVNGEIEREEGEGIKKEMVKVRCKTGTPLHRALEGRDMEAVQFLLKQKKIDVTCQDVKKRTLLMLTKKGDEEMIKSLLELGADATCVNTDNQNILFSQTCESLELFKTYIELGANVNQADTNCLTPLQIWAHSLPHVAMLLEKGIKESIDHKEQPTNFTALHRAASKGADGCVCALLNYSPKANAQIILQDYHGNTPLHLAARGGHLLVIQEFLKYIDDENKTVLEIVNALGETPLLKAAGCLEVTTALVDKGANVRAIDGLGQSALHHAVLKDNVRVVIYLIEKGLSLQDKNHGNKTPLDLMKKGTACYGIWR